MQPTDKFRSDLDGALRRAGEVPETRKLEALRVFFFSSFRDLPEDLLASLFTSFLERWRGGTEAALTWLAAVGSILLKDYDGTKLSRDDWVEIRDAFSLSAGELDLEILQYAMALVVEHGAI